MKYNVGDRVRIVKKWNKDTNQNSAGQMDKWLGKVMTIREVRVLDYRMKEDMDEHYGEGWYWNEACIEGLAHECNQKIVITSDGVETLARLYDGNKVVKSASAKCNPEDEFDFKIGARYAYERLMEEKPTAAENPDAPKKCKFEVGQYYEHKGLVTQGIIRITKIEDNWAHYEIVEGMIGDSPTKSFLTDSVFAMDTTPLTWKVVKRKVKKGDYVRLVHPNYSFNKVGDILKVYDTIGDGIHVLAKDHPRDTGWSDGFKWCYACNEVEVVELPGTEKPEPKPKKTEKQKYNGKVVCVDLNGCNQGSYTVGKVYQFKDGVITTDDGTEINGWGNIYTFKDWARFSSSKFIEVVE